MTFKHRRAVAANESEEFKVVLDNVQSVDLIKDLVANFPKLKVSDTNLITICISYDSANRDRYVTLEHMGLTKKGDISIDYERSEKLSESLPRCGRRAYVG